VVLAWIASVRQDAVWTFIVCGGGLFVGLLLAVGAWLMIRRWCRGGGLDDGGADLWSLDDLERMRDRGDLTEEEYRLLRARVIDAFSSDGSAGSSGRSGM